MTHDFMKEAIAALIKRGVATKDDFSQSHVSDEDLLQFEDDYDIKLPDSLKAYLQVCCFEFQMIMAAIPEDQFYDEDSFREGIYCEPLWMEIISVPKQNSLGELRERIEFLREMADDSIITGVTSDDVKNMIPVGDYMAGAGVMVMDLSFPESKVDMKDPKTWNIRWFDHEEFDWDSVYVEDGRPVGRAAFPSLEFLIDCYFCGKYDKIYEEQLQEDGDEAVEYNQYIDR